MVCFAYGTKNRRKPILPSLVFSLFCLSRANPMSEVDRFPANRTTARRGKSDP
jgi:hypothetical protein